MRHSPIAATIAAFVVALFIVIPARADGPSAQETAWRLLDYLAVDYGGAVADGPIVSQSEYAEMVEFAGEARNRVAALPPTPAQPSLISQAEALQSAIGRKAPKSEVSGLAKALGR